jgi:hypothetical protein
MCSCFTSWLEGVWLIVIWIGNWVWSFLSHDLTFFNGCITNLFDLISLLCSLFQSEIWFVFIFILKFSRFLLSWLLLSWWRELLSLSWFLLPWWREFLSLSWLLLPWRREFLYLSSFLLSYSRFLNLRWRRQISFLPWFKLSLFLISFILLLLLLPCCSSTTIIISLTSIFLLILSIMSDFLHNLFLSLDVIKLLSFVVLNFFLFHS